MARLLEIAAILVFASSLADGRAFHIRSNEKQLDPDILATVDEILGNNPADEVHAFEEAVDDCLKHGTKEHQRQLMLVSLDALRHLDDKLGLRRKRSPYQMENFDEDEFDRRTSQDQATILKEAPAFLHLFTDTERAEYDILYARFLAAAQPVKDKYIAAMIKATKKCASNENQKKRSQFIRYFNWAK